MEKRTYSKSGIPVYSYVNPHSHSFFISIYLRAGSMYESEDTAGITHFFEHIAIRNINRIMDGELYPLLDRYGLELNASTSPEMVQFYISGAMEYFRLGADIIARVLSPVVLTRAEVDKERDRIRAEIREVGEASSLSAFSQERVWDGTSLARSIMGSLGTVSKIGVRALEEYRRATLTQDNIFAYVTGNVPKEDITYLAAALDGYKLDTGATHDNVAPVPVTFAKRDGTVYVKNADFTGVRFSFDFLADEDRVPVVDILYDSLLGGYGSDFFIELSENRGLFYDLGGAVERYANVGTISFGYELKETRLYEALEVTVDILRRYKTAPAPEDKIIRAGYTTGAMMLYDDPRELNYTFAYDNHIMDCAYPDLASRRAAYEAVTVEDIRAAAERIFTPHRLTLALKGNKRRIDTDRIAEIIKSLQS